MSAALCTILWCYISGLAYCHSRAASSQLHSQEAKKQKQNQQLQPPPNSCIWLLLLFQTVKNITCSYCKRIIILPISTAGKDKGAQTEQNHSSTQQVLHTLNSAKIFLHSAFWSTCRCTAAQDLLPDSCDHLTEFHSLSYEAALWQHMWHLSGQDGTTSSLSRSEILTLTLYLSATNGKDSHSPWLSFLLTCVGSVTALPLPSPSCYTHSHFLHSSLKHMSVPSLSRPFPHLCRWFGMSCFSCPWPFLPDHSHTPSPSPTPLSPVQKSTWSTLAQAGAVHTSLLPPSK